MLSGQLIRLIEKHELAIADRIVDAICHSPELIHLGRLPILELREETREILNNLGHWLTNNNEKAFENACERIERISLEYRVPLYESALGLYYVKRKTIAFLDETGFDMDSLSLHAEGQIERQAGQFFDRLFLHLARGYETAWRDGIQTAHAVSA